MAARGEEMNRLFISLLSGPTLKRERGGSSCTRINRVSSNRVLVDGAGWWRKQKTVATGAFPRGGLGCQRTEARVTPKNGLGARGKVKVRADSDTRISDLERANWDSSSGTLIRDWIFIQRMTDPGLESEIENRGLDCDWRGLITDHR